MLARRRPYCATMFLRESRTCSGFRDFHSWRKKDVSVWDRTGFPLQLSGVHRPRVKAVTHQSAPLTPEKVALLTRVVIWEQRSQHGTFYFGRQLSLSPPLPLWKRRPFLGELVGEFAGKQSRLGFFLFFFLTLAEQKDTLCTISRSWFEWLCVDRAPVALSAHSMVWACKGVKDESLFQSVLEKMLHIFTTKQHPFLGFLKTETLINSRTMQQYC